jgi:hypothetical protein
MELWNWIVDLVEGPWSSRQRRLMEQRADYQFADFMQHFGREPEIAKEIWSALSDHALVYGFKPKPQDELLKVFGLAEEDLDDLVLRILQRCGCRIPSVAETGRMKPVRTVGDLFELVAEMKNPDRHS